MMKLTLSAGTLLLMVVSFAQAAVPPGTDIFPSEALEEQLNANSTSKTSDSVQLVDEPTGDLESMGLQLDGLGRRLSDAAVDLEENGQEQQHLANQLDALETSVKALVAMTEARIAEMSQRLAPESPEADAKEGKEPPSANAGKDAGEVQTKDVSDVGSETNLQSKAPGGEAESPSDAVPDDAADVDDKQEVQS